MGETPDERSLRALLDLAVPDGERERVSETYGLSKNAISRWISGDTVPGPAQFEVIAEMLGLSVERVGAAAAWDAYLRHKARLAQ